MFKFRSNWFLLAVVTVCLAIWKLNNFVNETLDFEKHTRDTKTDTFWNDNGGKTLKHAEGQEGKDENGKDDVHNLDDGHNIDKLRKGQADAGLKFNAGNVPKDVQMVDNNVAVKSVMLDKTDKDELVSTEEVENEQNNEALQNVNGEEDEYENEVANDDDDDGDDEQEEGDGHYEDDGDDGEDGNADDFGKDDDNYKNKNDDNNSDVDDGVDDDDNDVHIDDGEDGDDDEGMVDVDAAHRGGVEDNNDNDGNEGTVDAFDGEKYYHSNL